jgi:dolichol-phosphate mannosyltransferase
LSPSSTVTVIVPCYNEEAGLPSLLARLARMRGNGASDWHFLFVDDGSSDGTFGALLRAARDQPWVEVVRHHENLGLGAALRTGFAHARAPIVCTIDSDCTYPPEQLPRLAALVRAGAEIVTASAWHPESAAAEGSRVRLQLSRMVSGFYKRLIGQDVYTFTCLFRAYRREALERIRFRSDGFAAVAEIMLRAMLSGYTVEEVPMRLESRRFGESKLKVGDAVMAHARLLLMTALLVGARAGARQARSIARMLS